MVLDQLKQAELLDNTDKATAIIHVRGPGSAALNTMLNHNCWPAGNPVSSQKMLGTIVTNGGCLTLEISARLQAGAFAFGSYWKSLTCPWFKWIWKTILFNAVVLSKLFYNLEVFDLSPHHITQLDAKILRWGGKMVYSTRTNVGITSMACMVPTIPSPHHLPIAFSAAQMDASASII